MAENSLYETSLKLLKLEEIYGKQEMFLANKEKLDQYIMIKECFQIMNDITQSTFHVDISTENPHLKIDRASANNLQQHIANVYDFYVKGNVEEVVPYTKDLEKSVNLLTATCCKNEKHLNACQSIAESFDTIMKTLQKSNGI